MTRNRDGKVLPLAGQIAVLVGQVIGACYHPAVFRRLRLILGLGLAGLILTIILVVIIRVPVPALPPMSMP